MEHKIESHEDMIGRMVIKHFGENSRAIERMSIGLCNEVYNIKLSNREVIARLSLIADFIKGSQKHIPMLKEKGIIVPDILFEDYSRTDTQYVYQFLSKLPGKDLGLVIENLTDKQLNLIAKEVSLVMDIVRTIPSTDKFGYFYDSYEETAITWNERMKSSIDEAKKRSSKTGVLNDTMIHISEELYNKNEAYFNQVIPVSYVDDICSKNVMVHDGRFSGLVDLDCLAQGDYLETIGRIKASWPGTHYGEFYTNAIMDAQNLNKEQRKMVLVYALLNRISWASENGIQFNQNTKAEVDGERLKRDREIIDLLWEEYKNIK